MNVKQTLAAIKALRGMTARHVDGEYRVTFTQAEEPDATAREAAAHYTDDADDALATARHMCLVRGCASMTAHMDGAVPALVARSATPNLDDPHACALAPNETVVVVGGNAYRMDDGALMVAPVLLAGGFGEWDWCDPDLLPAHEKQQVARITDALCALAVY